MMAPIVVDLPAPFAPSRPTHSFARTARLTSHNARSLPWSTATLRNSSIRVPALCISERHGVRGAAQVGAQHALVLHHVLEAAVGDHVALLEHDDAVDDLRERRENVLDPN